MKNIIISLILIYSIYCSLDNCLNEEDQSQCTKHEIEYSGFSCYKYSEGSCIYYPKNDDVQKAYRKLDFGWQKEKLSAFSYYQNIDPSGINIFSKETYSLTDTIEKTEKEFTNNEQTIRKGGNTCAYLYFGRYLDDTNSQDYPNISDKNNCFNAVQFDELKDLIDCGYAEVTFKQGTNTKKINTCFYIPNDKMPNELLPYLKKEIFDPGFNEEGNFIAVFKPKQGSGRRLSTIGYEIVVENKNGKKVKYTSDSDEISVIQKGTGEGGNDGSNQVSVADTTQDGDKSSDKGKNEGNQNLFKLNIIFLLSYLLLIS